MKSLGTNSLNAERSKIRISEGSIENLENEKKERNQIRFHCGNRMQIGKQVDN